ncbi:hypothetical protein [Thermosulfurimonas dismutans]|uniref:Uncharacterized protein n=1 Tax=Thermosulfurimonas dismutans TaxID=999894 RepID=A0A179D4L8_9BACT|nr:hypothetical protein [Thermosulfurimonas dismutans]OAQ21015.1 hypothetical protein TDIS_0941 [Thermosulfurimonas dismutans]
MVEHEIKKLMAEFGPEAVLSAVSEALSRWVRVTGRCLLTGRRLAHEKICGYCRRCPVKPLERRA